MRRRKIRREGKRIWRKEKGGKEKRLKEGEKEKRWKEGEKEERWKEGEKVEGRRKEGRDLLLLFWFCNLAPSEALKKRRKWKKG